MNVFGYCFFCFLWLGLHVHVFSALTNESPLVGYSNVAPYMNIIKSIGVDELDLDISDEHFANAQILSSIAKKSNVYQKLGSYAVCVLSNDVDHGIILKISSSNDANYSVTVNGIKQLAMYNQSTGDKIPLMLVVTPGGWTNNTHAFGYSDAGGSASKRVPFAVGAPVHNGGDVPLYLSFPGDTVLPKMQRLKNLTLDSYGIINHYGLNPSLKKSDITVDSQNNGAYKLMKGCLSDKAVGDSEDFSDSSIVFDLYLNVYDLSRSSAGEYRLEFATSWADSNDISASGIVYDHKASSYNA